MIELAPYLPGFFAAYAIILIGASSPGPSVAMLIGIATSQGRNPALVATMGIAFGGMTINIMTMLGVGVILSQAAWAMTVLRVIGSGYLLYLAYGAFKKAAHPPKLTLTPHNRRSALRCFVTGYILQVSNPKAIIFWLAIASLGATEGAGWTVVLAFIAGAFLISFFCHGMWAVLLSSAPIRAAYTAGRRWIEAALGVFFCFAAYKIATSEN